jgi:hypothetical protein
VRTFADHQAGSCAILHPDICTFQGGGRRAVCRRSGLILDQTPLARSLDHYRRIIAVAVNTLLYGSATLLLGFIERLLEAWHRTGTVAGKFRDVVHQANLYRFFAGVLGISLTFASYFTLSEINERMGDGDLWSLFFQPPPENR